MSNLSPVQAQRLSSSQGKLSSYEYCSMHSKSEYDLILHPSLQAKANDMLVGGHTPHLLPLRALLTAAGIFFLGYALFAVPSTFVCAWVGAPRFLGGILVAWGCVATLFSCMRSQWQFYVLRFILGLAESGAYPGGPPRTVRQ